MSYSSQWKQEQSSNDTEPQLLTASLNNRNKPDTIIKQRWVKFATAPAAFPNLLLNVYR
jgi:hypothetical protein